MKNEVADNMENISVFEERADHLTDLELVQNTVLFGDHFDRIIKQLTARGTKLLSGPRGTGKTHLLRYVDSQCRKIKSKPFCVYTSFNRYFHLEPLLKSSPIAIQNFHIWVLCRILVSAHKSYMDFDNDSLSPSQDKYFIGEYRVDDLEDIIRRLEKGIGLTSEHFTTSQQISIDTVQEMLYEFQSKLGRTHTILLLDDASLTLTPEYLREFFDIVRVLKSSKISIKASVYPGTTEYGSRFHAYHESEPINTWLAVNDDQYLSFLEEVGKKRIENYNQIPDDIKSIFKYAAFGIPRAFMTMTREFLQAEGRNQQAIINQIIADHTATRFEEFKSIALKAPRLKVIIETGVLVFDKCINLIKEENLRLNSFKEKQLVFGIRQDELKPTLIDRMFRLMIEAGLLFQLTPVSHGEDRKYSRFIPHLASLLEARAFSQSSKGTSTKLILEVLEYKATKHPSRKTLQNLIGIEAIQNLKVDLPACENCSTPRLNEEQKFCHNCGQKLVDRSLFTQCMEIELTKVPGLTKWTQERLQQLGSINTVGELLLKQDPGTELRKIYRIGQVKANRIQNVVEKFVEEFLS